MGRKKPTLCKSWTDVLSNMMTKEQLLTMWSYREDFELSPEYLAVLKEALRNEHGISEEELNSMPDPGQYMKMQTGTRVLFLATLKRIGCKYEILDEDGRYVDDETSRENGFIKFSIQDNNFSARAYNDWDYVKLWKYIGYYTFKDDEEVARVTELVNRLNDGSLVTLIYDVWDLHKIGGEIDRKIVTFTLQITFPFIPTIPKLKQYLLRQFKFCFQTERLFTFELEKMRSAGPGAENSESRRSARLEKINTKLSNMKAKEEKESGSRDLFLKTLKRWKCPYEIDEYGDICFEYCGEEFFVEATNSSKFITIYDYGWNSASLDDIDEVSRVRKAINETNQNNCVNVFFAINEETNRIVVSSKMTILFIKSITGLSSYLKDVLSSFFRTHFLFDNEMERLKEADK